jgi:hypothetical protein
MNKTLRALLTVAGVGLGSVASAATTPAETAGMCAANAVIIKKVADQAGIPKLSAMASAQIARNYDRYGNRPGFKEAAAWQLKQNVSADDRLKIADGCAKEGF